MQLFYSQDIQWETIRLDEDESRHLKVLRKQAGDAIYVTDGEGHMYTTSLVSLNKRSELKIETFQKVEPLARSIHLAVSPTKNMDRMEWMVEKCGEIGISSIQFIKCRYSERKNLKTDRLKRKALSAMKQSQQCYRTEIRELLDFTAYLKEIAELPFDRKWIAHCEDDEKKQGLAEVGESGDYLILIGPEGDFSPEEIELAKESGFTPLHLGPTVLRTETAAMVATSLLRNWK